MSSQFVIPGVSKEVAFRDVEVAVNRACSLIELFVHAPICLAEIADIVVLASTIPVDLDLKITIPTLHFTGPVLPLRNCLFTIAKNSTEAFKEAHEGINNIIAGYLTDIPRYVNDTVNALFATNSEIISEKTETLSRAIVDSTAAAKTVQQKFASLSAQLREVIAIMQSVVVDKSFPSSNAIFAELIRIREIWRSFANLFDELVVSFGTNLTSYVNSFIQKARSASKISAGGQLLSSVIKAQFLAQAVTVCKNVFKLQLVTTSYTHMHTEYLRSELDSILVTDSALPQSTNKQKQSECSDAVQQLINKQLSTIKQRFTIYVESLTNTHYPLMY